MFKTTLERYLASAARLAILREKPKIVAVAGSVGKSSTKQAIAIALGAHIFGSDIRVSPKNYNNELGVPLTVLGRPAPGRSIIGWISVLGRAACLKWGLAKIGARTLVLEYGTDKPGDLSYLIDITRPDVAVLTAISIEHTEFFGTVEAVAEEELTLVRSLLPEGVAVVNADDARITHARGNLAARVVTFGEAADADVRVMSTRLVHDEADPADSGLEIDLMCAGENARVRLAGVFGRPHAWAAAAAMAVAREMGLNIHAAAERLKSYHGMPGRTRIISGIKKTILLDDSYNSSPLAALSAVRDLASFPMAENGRRIAALGDMLELGPYAESAHAELGEAAAKAGIDMLVACGTLAHVVARAAKEAGMRDDQVFVFAKSPEAGFFIQERMRQGDVILIKGSQGSRMEKVTKELMAEPLQAKELLVRQSEDWQA